MRGILCFGDSITFALGESGGWVGKLKKYSEPKGEHHCVFNLEVCGDTSDDLLERLDIGTEARVKYIHPEDKYTIIIAIGINDSKGIGEAEQFCIKPEKFKKNILNLISKSKKYTKDIFFVGLTLINEEITFPFEETYFSNKIIEKYNSTIKDCCKKNKEGFIDLFEDMSKKDYKKVLSDGLHPNSKGYDFIFNKVKKRVKWNSKQ